MKKTLTMVGMVCAIGALAQPAFAGKSKVGQIRKAMQGIAGAAELADNPLHDATDRKALADFRQALQKVMRVKRWNKVERLEKRDDGLHFEAWWANNDGGYRSGYRVEGVWAPKATALSQLAITNIVGRGASAGMESFARSGKLARVWGGFRDGMRTIELKKAGPSYRLPKSTRARRAAAPRSARR